MVAPVSVKPVESSTLFLDRLPRATALAFLACREWKWLRRNGWYLAGGTALALQVGHRQSVDLDFFTSRAKFPERQVERALLATGRWQTSYLESATIYGTFMNAKMSFIAYPFFRPAGEYLRSGNVRLLLPAEIAAMKIVAISQRGRKRDFVDLYWYCTNREPLAEVVKRAARQYPGQEKNMHHILKSLTYFSDAENDPLPKLYFSVKWPVIKTYFQRETKRLVKYFYD